MWTSGLYDCCEDIPNCFLTCFCPCVTFGRIAEIVDRGKTSRRLGALMVVAMSHIGCGWYYASKYRLKIRQEFSLPEEPCSDALIHCFCCGCALCQEHRELKSRGLDPSLGWQGNVAGHNPQGNTPPTVATGMDR
ncbi:PREDICTED: protein PLANT CADMIUM RESISTANCE 9 [Tarenaya hassleriana]|uniref:protein PLANT CADMIUM RESISTANCE 9 n=1 Tax=Tarenaya hassleriana TaxID=28532 RepID=UPI00053C0CE0|nr:PREDICTED: protein PLANT CADMIUM RESISTANCE 9 [Tarenaya hassleriana]